ncbi:DODA-type extradiol aromatic ring-opening family dioxygenase [Jhaorihella thermophila]
MAVLSVSGHWETDDAFAVMHAERPPMVYDYYGFPPETYEIVYPAPGAPELAEETAALIRDAGLKVRLDDEQGFDHGTFAPLAVMYPNADIPVFQVSIRRDHDPATHVELGRALAPLRDRGRADPRLGAELSQSGPHGAGRARAVRGLLTPGWPRRWPCPRPNGWPPCWTGRAPRTPAPAIRARITSCRCSWHSARPRTNRPGAPITTGGLFGGVTASNYRFG